MTHPNVPEPSVWADIAAELEKMAADCYDLIGQPAPAQFQIYVQPKPHDNLEALAAVDTIASVLLGKPGETKKMGNGNYHRNADGDRGPIALSIFRKVPAPDSRDEELALLRAEVAELKAKQAETAGLNYGRGDEGETSPLPATRRVESHTGDRVSHIAADGTKDAGPVKSAEDRCREAGRHIAPCTLARQES